MKPKILTTLPGYTRALLVQDVIAGVTVAMVALPLSLAIAIASGAGPSKGLITAIIAGFLISLLGGSRVQIGGPTGAFIVVVFSVIAEHGYDGLVLATLMAGLILLVAGYFRAGNLIRLIPEPVINGFTIGIAVIIATSQLKDLLGLTVDAVPAEFLEKIKVLWDARLTLSTSSALIGVATMCLIVLFRRAAPKLPGLIVAVAATSAIVTLVDLPVETIQSRFGDLPNTLPWPAMPEISFDRVVELLPSALIIAFLAGVESLLSAMVADRMIEGSHRPNAELLAQGAANIGPADLAINGILMPAAATIDLVQQIENAGPFGSGAPAPRFAFPDCMIGFAKKVGESHLKISFGDGIGKRIDAICFGAMDGPIGPMLLAHNGGRFHLVGRLELNTWQGRQSVQLRLEDAAPAH